VGNAFALSKLCGAQSVIATVFARRQRFDAVPSITLPQHAAGAYRSKPGRASSTALRAVMS